MAVRIELQALLAVLVPLYLRAGDDAEHGAEPKETHLRQENARTRPYDKLGGDWNDDPAKLDTQVLYLLR
jgi:hypothetical protein